MWELSHVRLPMQAVSVMRHDPTSGYNMSRMADKVAERFAGYYSERERLWGAEELRRLGLWWLPQLAGHNLAVPAESLAEFREECVTALEATAGWAVEAGCKETDIRQALRNFLRSASEAESIGGWIKIS